MKVDRSHARREAGASVRGAHNVLCRGEHSANDGSRDCSQIDLATLGLGSSRACALHWTAYSAVKAGLGGQIASGLSCLPVHHSRVLPTMRGIKASLDLRWRIVYLLLDGFSQTSVASLLFLGRRTVQRVWQQFKSSGDVASNLNTAARNAARHKVSGDPGLTSLVAVMSVSVTV